ncbi:MAG TPA: hypothetical protein DCX77_00880 [Acidimicrobiaceae bacterium]|nr:hypothetical protein [Acidimicrobiaceae bacterium]|tara:strand:+ start:4379 stop:4801 length:423 start_codon:yes stop_codon:yes gene_type:complete
MAFSQYFATQVLSWVKGAPFPTALSNVYISLHSSDPGDAGANGDVTSTITNSANRTQISSAALSAVVGASGGGFEVTNTGVVQLTTSANNTSPITVTHFGVWDAASGGNFLASGALTSSVDVEVGDTVQFNIGAMAVRAV